MQADKPIPLTWLWVIEIVTFGIIEYKRYQNFKKIGEVSLPSIKADQIFIPLAPIECPLSMPSKELGCLLSFSWS